MKQKETSWGGVAEWYDDALEQRGDTYQRTVILPNVLRLLGLDASVVKGARVILDLACGQGFFAREIARVAPASFKIIASDISAELIDLARKNPDPATARIEYHVNQASDISFLGNESVDAILISLAIQNIEDLSAVFQECARVLKTDRDKNSVNGSGRLILVLNHPAFRIPKRSSWQWDESDQAAAKEYRRLDAYMSESAEKIDMTPGTKRNGASTQTSATKFTLSFHRPLQFYFKALAKAGFAMTRLEEWISPRTSQPGPRAAEEDRMRKEIPLFLMIEAQKAA